MCPPNFEISILEECTVFKLTLIEKYVISINVFFICDKNQQQSLFSDRCLSSAPEFKYTMTALTSVARGGWVSVHKAKGHQFNSRSGHKPGLRFGPQLGRIIDTATRCFSLTSMFLSLSFSFPCPISKIK